MSITAGTGLRRVVGPRKPWISPSPGVASLCALCRMRLRPDALTDRSSCEIQFDHVAHVLLRCFLNYADVAAPMICPCGVWSMPPPLPKPILISLERASFLVFSLRSEWFRPVSGMQGVKIVVRVHSGWSGCESRKTNMRMGGQDKRYWRSRTFPSEGYLTASRAPLMVIDFDPRTNVTRPN